MVEGEGCWAWVEAVSQRTCSHEAPWRWGNVGAPKKGQQRRFGGGKWDPKDAQAKGVEARAARAGRSVLPVSAKVRTGQGL